MDQYFLQGLAPATQRTYQSAKNRYINFCRTFQLLAIPATEQQLCRFSAFLAESNLMHNSIKYYLAAVRHLHITVGAVDPHISSMPRLQLVLKGIKHQQAKEQHMEQPRLPITPTILRKLKDVWLSNPSLDNIMLWAAASLCFFGFLRAGETTVPSETAFDQGAHLTLSDVTVDSFKSPKMLKIKIKASKTDPFRNGIDIYVGTTNSDLCPVTAVLTYIVKRPLGNGPLFKFINGRPLTRSLFVEHVRKALTLAGVNADNYAGHSFRSGAATTAAKQGLGDATIKMLGRWKSNAYQLYIKTPRQQLAAVSRCLVVDTGTTKSGRKGSSNHSHT